MRIYFLSALAAIATCGTLAARQTPATTPATTNTASASATTTATATTPAFSTHFEGGDSITDYFTALAIRFGVTVVQATPVHAFIIKPFDLPAKLDDAVALGQAALTPQGLALHQSVSGTMIVLSVMTTEQARQAELQESPVSSGPDLEKIDITHPDRLVTHLLPISHLENAAALQQLAARTKDVKADVAGTAETGVTLILTGPAKGVQEAAAAILKVDTPDSSKTVIKTLQLHNLNAEELATSLNATFTHQEGAPRAAGDRRTNTIIITGPEDKVLDAMVGIISMEVSRGRGTPMPAPAPAAGSESQPALPPASQPAQ